MWCVSFSKVAGLKSATLLKVTLLHGCFSRFLNCTNGTYSRQHHKLFISLRLLNVNIKLKNFNTRSTLWVTSLKRRKASSCWVVYVKEIGLDNFYRYFYHKNVEKCFQLSFRSFFSIWVFFHEHSRITGLQRNGKGISLNPHYHFHPLHRHLNISWTFTSAHS